MNAQIEKVIFTEHARVKMEDRGATKEEVKKAISEGSCEPARKGRVMMRKNFPYNAIWRGKHYAVKQVAPVVKREGNTANIITVYVYYF